MTGLCIFQYDACQNMPFLTLKYYAIFLSSILIRALCSFWNERLIKTYSVSIHSQNAILYSFGLMLNLALFFFMPNSCGQNDSKKHSFEGYSLSVYASILCNSVLGIVITFVYKYADAIVKTFSTACATGVLLHINVAVFRVKTNLTVFLGAVVIFVSSYLFLLVKPTSTIVPVNLDPDVGGTRNETHESKWTQNFGWNPGQPIRRWIRSDSMIRQNPIGFLVTKSHRNPTVGLLYIFDDIRCKKKIHEIYFL